ncbi:MAG: GNAT family N-acetyltransferase [Proteobacteria bacterium]|nr:GNAT family N-acetyltransferase [Pseudomonadota bacterium]
MIKIESERLVLYPIENDALKLLIEQESNDGLKQAYSEMLQGCLDDPEHRIWYTAWFIELKSQPGTVVGDLSFKGLNADGMVEIGYGLRDGFCGNGYMREAVRSICPWAMKQEGVTRVEAEVTTDNRASHRVLYHAGFIPTGVCGEEGPRFLYRTEGSFITGYQVLERKPTGSGYDLKLKVSVDGEIRYLYYSEMPDRCYIRGWSFYEISESNYNANKREPYIRFIGSISGDNDIRADYVVYRALKEGLYIKSEWDCCYGDIYLVKDLKK